MAPVNRDQAAMRNFFRLLRRFRSDEKGVFLPLFGVMAIVLVAVSGAVVDFVRIDQARNKAQLALDAAALALQPDIYDTSKPLATLKADLKDKAQKLLVERLADSSLSAGVDEVDLSTTDGTLFLRGQVTVPMAFVGLVGINSMKVNVISQATRKQLYVEVAFVLDNSGSMGSYNRLTNLKSAAKCATKILFYGSCTPPSGAVAETNVKISVVPFTTFVNVGTGNANASWMDTTGTSSIANDNFDNDDDDSTPFSGAVNRFQLYNQLSNVSWAGCVEARKYPYSVNDTTPVSSNPDTLFDPVFQPDEPDSGGYSNSYLNNSPGACPSTGGSWTWSWSGWTWSGSSLSDREKQERLCKYTGSASFSGTHGPNSDCVSTPLLPLTNNPTSVLNEINAMSANGNTNIHQGAIWGFHVLSPTQPFTQGRPYDTATSKVMIIMTDGENTFGGSGNMNGSSFLQAYGHFYNAPPQSGTAYTKAAGTRLGYTVNNNGQMTTVMNKLTEETCTNAKAANIKVYTIGLSPPNTATRDMLKNCSSGEGFYKFPSDPNELNTIFADIANQLSPLRLAK